MPVIVIGADTSIGEAILTALRDRDGEIRAFVSDETVAEALRRTEVKVALGDLSDSSHVEGACTNVFCAVLVTAAVHDGRELAFGAPAETMAGWAAALRRSRVSRALWVGDSPDELTRGSAPEVAVIPTEGLPLSELAARVAQLDDALEI